MILSLMSVTAPRQDELVSRRQWAFLFLEKRREEGGRLRAVQMHKPAYFDHTCDQNTRFTFSCLYGYFSQFWGPSNGRQCSLSFASPPFKILNVGSFPFFPFREAFRILRSHIKMVSCARLARKVIIERIMSLRLWWRLISFICTLVARFRDTIHAFYVQGVTCHLGFLVLILQRCMPFSLHLYAAILNEGNNPKGQQ